MLSMRLGLHRAFLMTTNDGDILSHSIGRVRGDEQRLQDIFPLPSKCSYAWFSGYDWCVIDK